MAANQKAMEVASLSVLVSLWEKSGSFAMQALTTLQPATINYITQIAAQYDTAYHQQITQAMTHFLEQQDSHSMP